MDRKPITIILLMVSLVVTGWPLLAPAQESAQERDPFFSAGPRATMTAPAAEDKAWGRDPFARPFEGAAQRTPAQGGPGIAKGLTGIIFSSEVRIAIIDGETYREGAVIGDRKLSHIGQRSIVLMSSTGGKEEFFLADFSIRK